MHKNLLSEVFWTFILILEKTLYMYVVGQDSHLAKAKQKDFTQNLESTALILYCLPSIF